MPRPRRDVRVAALGVRAGIGPAAVQRAVRNVLDGERTGPTVVDVTFLSSQRMRALNRRAFGHDRATDVIAFRLPHPGRLVGDVYVCPAFARRTAREGGIPLREEMIRLVVHGTLHVLGQDHPTGRMRERSPMWRRQEHYVRATVADSP